MESVNPIETVMDDGLRPIGRPREVEPVDELIPHRNEPPHFEEAHDDAIVMNERAPSTINVEVREPSPNEIHKNYFVKLPHSNYEFDVRGLTIEEEDKIKSSNTSAKRIAESIMRILYDCISDDIKQPNHPFGSYNTFCTSISLADRDALALAVIQQTYGATHEMAIPCRNCRKSFTESVCIADCMDLNIYDGDVPILQQRKVLEFPEYNWRMYLKIPTVADELSTLSANDRADEIQRASDYIFIDKLEFAEKNEQGRFYEDTFTNYVAIYGMLKKKPAIVRKKIMKEYENFRGDWGVTGKYETTCKFCGSPVEVLISPISHLLFLLQ